MWVSFPCKHQPCGPPPKGSYRHLSSGTLIECQLPDGPPSAKIARTQAMIPDPPITRCELSEGRNRTAKRIPSQPPVPARDEWAIQPWVASCYGSTFPRLSTH